jgi:hypothetical protein
LSGMGPLRCPPGRAIFAFAPVTRLALRKKAGGDQGSLKSDPLLAQEETTYAALRTDFIAGHIRFHILPKNGGATADQERAADDLFTALRAYLK